MKKIVAVVLALVMVLGLATTAFAATAGVGTYDAVILDADGEYGQWSVKLVETEKEDADDNTFALYEVEAKALVKDAVMWWADDDTADKGEVETIEIGGVDEWVKVSDAALAELIVVDGDKIVYLADAEDFEDGYFEKAKEVKFFYTVPAKWECDTLYAPTETPVTCYEWNETLFVEATDGEFLFNVDGVAVYCDKATIADMSVTIDGTEGEYDGEDLIYTGHVYQLDSKGNTYTEKNIEKVYCDACDTSFKFALGAESDAVKAFKVGNYANAGLWGQIPVWVGTATGASTPAGDAAEGDKVTSAETFDAGIAMYVGMSVMAAAGSAVVLKKKD